MKSITYLNIFSGIILAAIIALSFGCGESESVVKEPEAPLQPTPTELMQQEVGSLRSQNETLQQQVAKCEVEKRTITARVAELETELAEWKEKATPPAPPIITDRSGVSNPRESYANALRLFNERNYSDAAELIQKVQRSDIPSSLLDNCDYWLGECAYGDHKYSEAIAHFKKVFSYAVSEKKDDAQIMIGNCYKAMGNKTKAKETYEELLKKYPASPFVKRTKEKIEKL
ncbi:MAG: tetratricopeptide repeat protein [Ignavibacteriales bacterium]|nr:tetratricopeptide repeat protein [Ignavibacteriales bacterium]